MKYFKLHPRNRYWGSWPIKLGYWGSYVELTCCVWFLLVVLGCTCRSVRLRHWFMIHLQANMPHVWNIYQHLPNKKHPVLQVTIPYMEHKAMKLGCMMEAPGGSGSSPCLGSGFFGLRQMDIHFISSATWTQNSVEKAAHIIWLVVGPPL